MSLTDFALPWTGQWHEIASATHLVGACASASAAGMIARAHRRFGMAGKMLALSMLIASLWSLAITVAGGVSPASEALLAARNLAWLASLTMFFARDGRLANVMPVRPVLLVLAILVVLQGLTAGFEASLGGSHMPFGEKGMMLFHFDTMLSTLGAVGSLVLVHNLYIGADTDERSMLRWPALALGLVWIFELNLYTVAWLANAWPVALAAAHGIIDIAAAAILALGAVEGQSDGRLALRPSRAVTFRSVSLLIIGAYFVAMIAVAQWLADSGGNFARWYQFGFLIITSSIALLVLPSSRLRGWLRVMLAKHLFQHRYDYRAEWLRFTRTVGRPGSEAEALEERVIRALADITDSPAGLLLAPNDRRDLVAAARWNWHSDIPAIAMPASNISSLETEEGFIVEIGNPPEDFALPDWLAQEPRAWVIVPLLHFERLVGCVVLASPPASRRLDWEDFDLLRVAGGQLASYLAEHSSQQALAEASRFDDFHRRIAFVMHDIKNLASQFSLLARNAERHADNPAFRADMLVTLRSSADRLGVLVARLSRYGTGAGGGIERIEALDTGKLARLVATRLAEGGRLGSEHHTIQVIERAAITVLADAHALEQVLTHLVQNALDASDPARASMVFISIVEEAPWVRIEVVDSGHGMSPDFMRHRLFRPFDSSKAGGFGIGAFEARELVRAMEGRLEVESREGLGTRFTIFLPLAPSSSVKALRA